MASFSITGYSTTAQTLDDNETGFIGQNADLYSATSRPILILGAANLTILGNVVSNGFFGIDMRGDTNVTIGAQGSIISTDSNAISANYASGATFTISNSGLVQGEGVIGYYSTQSAEPFGHNVNNSGTMINTAEGASAVRLAASKESFFVNTGDIQSVGSGVSVSAGSGVDTHMINSGTIIAVNQAYLGFSGNQKVTNSGLMVGDVELGDGNDLFDGTLGTIEGAVYGQNGEDRLIAGVNGTQLFGGADNDELFGGEANDRLDGGAANDRLEGRGGNDTYVVAAEFDVVVEREGEGIDRVISYISHEIDAYVEVLELVSGNINGTGNASDNVIIGTTGANVLNGRAGADELRGEAGADTFVFETALGEVDWLSDFDSVDDKIQLDADIFSNINSGGFIASNQLSETGLATSAAHRIVYDPVTGALSYDADGVGAIEAVQFAEISAGLDLVRWDFQII